MKRCYFGLILCLFVFAHVGCSDSPAANDSNTAAAVPTEANTAPISTPLPEFTDANAALAEGNRLLDATETEKAIEALSQAVKLDPELAEAHFQLGVAYALIEARDAEIGETTETPTPNPKEKKSREKTNSEKAFENAAQAYKKLIEKNEDDDVAHFNLGRAYNKLNEDEDAARSLRQAVRLKPDDTEYQTELGSILVKLAKYGEAVGALTKALEFDPSNSKAEELLAKAESGQKRIGFSAVKKDEKKDDKSDDSANTNAQPDDSRDKPKTSQSNTKKPSSSVNRP